MSFPARRNPSTLGTPLLVAGHLPHLYQQAVHAGGLVLGQTEMERLYVCFYAAQPIAMHTGCQTNIVATKISWYIVWFILVQNYCF